MMFAPCGAILTQWRLLQSQLVARGPGWYSPAELKERLFESLKRKGGSQKKRKPKAESQTSEAPGWKPKTESRKPKGITSDTSWKAESRKTKAFEAHGRKSKAESRRPTAEIQTSEADVRKSSAKEP